MTRWYLRKKRDYKYGSSQIVVHPGVFHPGLFPSTPMLLRYLRSKSLKGVSLLELGCGTGLISVEAAKAGAKVTASDVSTLAFENAKHNAALNHIEASFILSDVFQNIPAQTFDWIVINPPYYKGVPDDEPGKAWYAGPNMEYYEKLFLELRNYLHQNSQVIMSLTQGCDIDSIKAIAAKNDLALNMVDEQHSWLDGKDYVFAINAITKQDDTKNRHISGK